MSPTRIVPLLIFVVVAPLSAADPLARIDLAGDPLPPGAIARIGTLRYRPRPYLEQVFFTADGSTVIGRGQDNVIHFWEAETGKTTLEFRDPDLINFKIDLSSDGTRLAVFGHDKRGKPQPDTTLRVYDVATRKPLWTKVIDDEYHYQHSVHFSLDGSHIITATQSELRVWNAAAGELIRKQRTMIGYAGADMSPDGQTFVYVNRDLVLWDWTTGAPPRTIPLGKRRIENQIVFSPDGKTIYGREYGLGAHAFDVASGKFVGTVDESALNWRSLSPDGKTLATAEYDKVKREGWVVLRDAVSQKELRRLSSGSIMVRSGRWSKDGGRLAGADAYRAWVWDVKTGKAFGPTVPGHAAPVTNLFFNSDGRLITGSDDLTVRAWDPATGKELRRLLSAPYVLWHLAASPDGSLLANPANPNDIRVWDAKSGDEVYRLRWSISPLGGVVCPKFSADGQTLLTYGSDNYLRAWDLTTGKLKVERYLRPDGLPKPKEDDELLEERGFGLYNPRLIALGPDGNTVVLGHGKDASAYALDSGKEHFKLAADEQRLEGLILSPDGKRLATTGMGPPMMLKAGEQPKDYQVTVWDMTQAKQVCRFRGAGRNFYVVLAFTPDGQRLVTGANNETLHVWDAAAGKLVGTIELPRPPTRVAFSPDGKLLAVAFQDPTVLIYDMAAAIKK